MKFTCFTCNLAQIGEQLGNKSKSQFILKNLIGCCQVVNPLTDKRLIKKKRMRGIEPLALAWKAKESRF